MSSSHNKQDSQRDHNNESQSAQLGHNLNSYIRNLDVSNVLAADLASINQNYIDPSIAAAAYKRATSDGQGNDNETVRDKDGYVQGDADENGDDALQHLMPPLPPGADPKKMCPFCQRTFSHPGSMGRHLDLKKGSENHPADLIMRMRADVKRRGDVERVRERRRIRAKRYNSRIDVKERSKVKRRVRERVQRARRIAINKFAMNLNKPQLSYQPTFPRLVLYFLPPNQWPHDPPTLETYRSLCEYLNGKFLNNSDSSSPEQNEISTQYYDDIMQKVHSASENWLTLSDHSKNDIWLKEIRKSAEDALMNTSLFDLANREIWVTEQARKTIQNEFKGEEEEESASEDDEQDANPQAIEPNDDNVVANERQRTTNFYNHDDLTAVAEAVINNHGTSSQ